MAHSIRAISTPAALQYEKFNIPDAVRILDGIVGTLMYWIQKLMQEIVHVSYWLGKYFMAEALQLYMNEALSKKEKCRF